MIAVTVICLAALVYVYLGYPALCALLGAVRRRTVAARPWVPRATVLIAARNEAACIEATVRNKLEQDYPAELLDVIVVSDASDDGTDEIVTRVAADHPGRVRLIRQEERKGKTAALNRAVRDAAGEILIFSDANSLYGPGALRILMEPFADPQVGYVTGRMVYRAPDGSLSGEGCSAYMAYENRLRSWETAVGSIVGVDGGIDAVRAACYEPMRPDQQPDFVLPLTVAERGLRVVHEPRALLYEDALSGSDDEFRMRVRVILRAWHALKDKAAVLAPWRTGLFAWQVFSHKVLRYLAPVFQVALALVSVITFDDGGLWTVLAAGQGLFYIAAVVGHLFNGRPLPSLVVLSYYLCLVNAAAGVALLRFLRGDRQVVWQPRT